MAPPSRDISSGLANRGDFHVLRKVWHSCVGTLLALSHGFVLTRGEGTLLFSFLLVLCIILETARRQSGTFNHMMVSVLGPLMRSHEVNRLAGTFYYALGCWCAAALFPKPVAVLAILSLSWVDPVASAVGILLPSHCRLSNGKSYLGGVVGGGVCFVVCVQFLSYAYPVTDRGLLLIVAACTSIFATLCEVTVPTPPSGTFPLNTDDNFVIPAANSLFLFLLLSALGVLQQPNLLYE